MTCPCSLGQECNCGLCRESSPRENPLAFFVGVRNALAVTAVVAAVCAVLALGVL